MATAVGLAMKITADTAGIARGVSNTERQLGRLSKQAASTTSALRTLAGIEIGRLVVGGLQSIASTLTSGARFAVNYASGVVQAVDATNDLAQRTGIAVEALQAFQIAGQLTGADVTGGIQRLSVAIGKAGEDGEKAEATFRRFGLNLAELQSLSPEDQFRAVAAAISALPTQAERAAAAVQLLGRSGVELLPAFAELPQIEARLERLNATLTQDQVAAIDEIGDAFTLVRSTIDGIIGQVTANLAPVVTAIADEFLAFVEGFQGIDGGAGGAGIADVLTSAILDGVDVLAGWADKFIASLTSWVEYFSRPVAQLGGWFEYFQTAVELLQAAFYGIRIVINGIIGSFAELVRRAAALLSSSTAEAIQDFQDGLAASMASDQQAMSDAFMGRNRNRPEAESGPGFLQSTVRETRAGFDNRNSPEAIAERERAKQQRTFDRLSGVFASAAADAAEIFGDDIPSAVARAATGVQDALTSAFADGAISDEELKRIQAAQAAYNTSIRDGKKALDDRKKAEEQKQRDIENIQERLSERSKELEADRLENLSRRNQQALNVGDIRTSEGIGQFLALATGREDPAITEYRKQLSELQKLRQELREAQARPVEI